MTTEELKQQEEERQKKKAEKDKKYLEENLPKFEAELKVLCEKYQLAIEGFCTRSDKGCSPQIRVRMTNPSPNPYDRP